MHRLPIIQLLLLAALALLPHRAHAQVIRHCTAADGTQIYTDRRCSDVDAVDSPGRALGGGAQPAKPYARGCSRSLHDLLFELTTAIEGSDVNRLAGVYDWAGMSSRSGYALMGRLGVIAKRPLVGVYVVQPQPQVAVQADGSTTVSGSVAAQAFPGAAVRSAPVAVRVEQTSGNGITPTRTVFGLRRRMGCWWVSF